MKNILLFIIFTILMQACKHGKKPETIAPIEVIAVDTQKVDAQVSREEIAGLLNKNKLPFETFSAKMKVVSERNGSSNPDVMLNLRMIKDSAIWISASATLLNVEVYRMYVTKDSVTVIDKLNTSYSVKPITYLQQLTGLPFDLPSLQDFLVGNVIFIDEKNATLIKAAEGIILSSTLEGYENTIQFNEAGSLFKFMLKGIAPGDIAIVEQGNYSGFGDHKFAANRKATVQYNAENINAVIDFSDVEFNKSLQLNMQPPKNYTRN